MTKRTPSTSYCLFEHDNGKGMTYSPWGNCWRVQQNKDQQRAKQVTRIWCSRSWKLKNRNLLRWLLKLNLLTLYQGLKDVLTLKKLYWLVGFQEGKGITHRPVGGGGFIYMHHHFKSHDLVTSYTFSFLFRLTHLLFQ